MKRSLGFYRWGSLGLLITLLAVLPRVEAQDIFKGKAILIIVPFSAGGGYDTYARIIARHMRQHIPGNPEIIIQNMPGGGGLRAANYFHHSVKSDGPTGKVMLRDMYFTQLTGQPGVMYEVP